MSRHAAFWIGLALLPMSSGCFYIPMWRVPTHPACQHAEDTWGDVVDFVGNQSPIDRPWHDPQYCPQGVYRVAAPGSLVPAAGEIEQTPEATDPPPAPAPIDDMGDLKPPIMNGQ